MTKRLILALVGIGFMAGCTMSPTPAPTPQAKAQEAEQETAQEAPSVWTPKYEVKLYANGNIYSWQVEECDFVNSTNDWIKFQDKDKKWWWVRGNATTIQCLQPDEQ